MTRYSYPRSCSIRIPARRSTSTGSIPRWITAKAHFADSEYGEWYGYLRRDGKPTEPPCKGSTFKGPFHLPRMLIMTDLMAGELLAE